MHTYSPRVEHARRNSPGHNNTRRRNVITKRTSRRNATTAHNNTPTRSAYPTTTTRADDEPSATPRLCRVSTMAHLLRATRLPARALASRGMAPASVLSRYASGCTPPTIRTRARRAPPLRRTPLRGLTRARASARGSCGAAPVRRSEGEGDHRRGIGQPALREHRPRRHDEPVARALRCHGPWGTPSWHRPRLDAPHPPPHQVVSVSHVAENCETITNTIKAEGNDGLAVTADCTDYAQVEKLRDAVLKEYGQVRTALPSPMSGLCVPPPPPLCTMAPPSGRPRLRRQPMPSARADRRAHQRWHPRRAPQRFQEDDT